MYFINLFEFNFLIHLHTSEVYFKEIFEFNTDTIEVDEFVQDGNIISAINDWVLADSISITNWSLTYGFKNLKVI